MNETCLLSVARRAFTVLIFALFSFHSLRGSVSGSISGTVTDPHSLPVASAKVTAINPATNFRQVVLTDESGFYFFPELPVSTYDLEVESKGFRVYRQTHLMV